MWRDCMGSKSLRAGLSAVLLKRRAERPHSGEWRRSALFLQEIQKCSEPYYSYVLLFYLTVKSLHAAKAWVCDAYFNSLTKSECLFSSARKIKIFKLIWQSYSIIFRWWNYVMIVKQKGLLKSLHFNGTLYITISILLFIYYFFMSVTYCPLL